MSQSKGFDMSRLSTAGKILIVAGALYFIDAFLPWQRVDLGPIGSASSSGASGIGVLNLILSIALVAWEVLWAMDVKVTAPRALVSAGLAGALLVFTILKIVIDSEFLFIFAWIGLILALVIAYGGWLRWQEHQAGGGGGGGMPAPPGEGMS